MSTITAAADTPKPLYTSLFVQVLVALLLGIVLGMAAPDFAVGLKVFSDAFLKLISMIVHEIATNAAKYGALSNDSGTVTLDWEVLEEGDGRKLRMIWTEAGGPHVSAPVQRGFGSRLIERSARDQLGGEATVDFLPRGVVCTLTSALDHGN